MRSARSRFSTVLIVSRLYFASPERMFALLAPSSYSSPRPFEWRRSSSAASLGWFVTIGRLCSFSHQRNAGQSSLLPCSSPAWHAPVCDDQSVSHEMRWCDPSRSHRPTIGMLPLRSAHHDLVREAVDLEEDHARDVGRSSTLASGGSPDDVAVVEVFVVDS